MEYSISYQIYFRVAVSLVFLCFFLFLSASFPRFQAGTSGEKNLPSSKGEFGKCERGGCGTALKLAISDLASVKKVLVLLDNHCIALR